MNHMQEHLPTKTRAAHHVKLDPNQNVTLDQDRLPDIFPHILSKPRPEVNGFLSN